MDNFFDSLGESPWPLPVYTLPDLEKELNTYQLKHLEKVSPCNRKIPGYIDAFIEFFNDYANLPGGSKLSKEEILFCLDHYEKVKNKAGPSKFASVYTPRMELNNGETSEENPDIEDDSWAYLDELPKPVLKYPPPDIEKKLNIYQLKDLEQVLPRNRKDPAYIDAFISYFNDLGNLPGGSKLTKEEIVFCLDHYEKVSNGAEPTDFFNFWTPKDGAE